VVVDEAAYPIKPLGMGLPVRIAIGAVGGLLVGILAAILVGVLDRRVRGREPVASTTNSAVIGDLPADAARAKVAVVKLDRAGTYAERLRELRTNLRFARLANDDDPPTVIAITSPSAADGRTTVAIDLAVTLAESGRNVVLVDGDFRGSSLSERLPLSGPAKDAAAARGLSTTIAGETNVVEAVIPNVSVGHHRVAFLPAGPIPPRPGELWASDRATALLDELADVYDYVIIDTPPLAQFNDGALVAALSDGALLLARIRKTTSTALRRSVQTLQTANAALIGTVTTFEPGHGSQGDVSKQSGTTAPPKPASPRKVAVTAEPTTEGLVGSTGAQRTPRSRHGSG